jgi:hypothetical protein
MFQQPDTAQPITEVGFLRAAQARHRSEWLTSEVAILKSLYPTEGSPGVKKRLPHRTPSAIRAKAAEEGIKCKRLTGTLGLTFERRFKNSEALDTAIREGYMHATQKGDILRLANRLDRPAWWVQKRAAKLGMTRTNRTRLDSWTKPELDILETYASASIAVIGKKLRAAGFKRTETGVAVKLKRLKLDRQDPDAWCANSLAPMIGVDPNTIRKWIESHGLTATRADATGRYRITRRNLRAWVARNHQRIDLRRVDQTWFMELIFGAWVR